MIVNEEFRELLLTLMLDFNDMATVEPDRFNPWQRVTIVRCIDQLRALKDESYEIVAWRVQDFNGNWILCQEKDVARHEAEETGHGPIEPLYRREGYL